MKVQSIISHHAAIAWFCWRQVLLLISLFVMTLGVALCVRSQLGSSVISSLPLSFSTAGATSSVPQLSLGMYTNLLNIGFVALQLLILRGDFGLAQLLQLAVSLVFGVLIDFSMFLTSPIDCTTVLSQSVVQFVGCTVMGLGVAMEVRCKSVTMAGEGLPVAISRTWGLPFAKAKIMVDCSLVVLAVVSCYLFFGSWQWNIVGPGTLFAMFYVGLAVKFFGRRLGWFGRLVNSE